MRNIDQVITALEKAVIEFRKEVAETNVDEIEGEGATCGETFLYLTMLTLDLAQHVKALQEGAK